MLDLHRLFYAGPHRRCTVAASSLPPVQVCRRRRRPSRQSPMLSPSLRTPPHPSLGPAPPLGLRPQPPPSPRQPPAAGASSARSPRPLLQWAGSSSRVIACFRQAQVRSRPSRLYLQSPRSSSPHRQPELHQRNSMQPEPEPTTSAQPETAAYAEPEPHAGLRKRQRMSEAGIVFIRSMAQGTAAASLLRGANGDAAGSHILSDEDVPTAAKALSNESQRGLLQLRWPDGDRACGQIIDVTRICTDETSAMLNSDSLRWAGPAAKRTCCGGIAAAPSCWTSQFAKSHRCEPSLRWQI
jgi:hypothetical protein